MERKLGYSDFATTITERTIVALEFGRNYTRCGFVGEPVPRAIIKTAVVDSKTNQLIYLHSIRDLGQLRTHLGNFVDKLYFEHLAVSPKEKKVVIVESVFCTSLLRNTLTSVFFDRFNVPSILFVPDHLMALATLGTSTGIVVDIGAEEAISIAVVDGVTLLDGAQFAGLGARTLDSLIADELLKVNGSQIAHCLTPKVVEDVRVKACFVAPFPRGCKMTSDKLKRSKFVQSQAIRAADEKNQEVSMGSMEDCYFLAEPDDKSPATVNYSLAGCQALKVPGNLREGACEIFFEIFAHEHSLTTCIIETILQAPIDCRRVLAENILVIGGLANLPGLEHRLSEELTNIDKYERFRRKIPDRFKFHTPICPKNYVSWLGASMFCTPSAIELRSTTRDQWNREGKKHPRDWSDLIAN